MYFIFLFFFFQAEDGIRDLTVTGVQTCALPISRAIHSRPLRTVVHVGVTAAHGRTRRVHTVPPHGRRTHVTGTRGPRKRAGGEGPGPTQRCARCVAASLHSSSKRPF